MKRPVGILGRISIIGRIFGLIVTLPFTMGARGGCGGALDSMAPAPDVAGNWAVSYGSTMEVDVDIGGTLYHSSLPLGGGAFTVVHAGQPLQFSVDCSRPEVVCPSEVWPNAVSIDQRDPTFPHRMWVRIPTQTCSGSEVAPDPTKCGAGTNNPDCKPVCTGTVTTSASDAFGVIDDAGDAFDLLLGAGVATNGLNCALLGLSSAHASLVDTGAVDSVDWQAQQMTDGTVKTAYAGGCLWAGDPNMSGQLQALVVGASVTLTTPFTATRIH
jgi:hypothetical protein